MTTTLFDLPAAIPSHPAQYTPALYPVFVGMLRGCKRLLDPFGGKGGIFELAPWLPGCEIEAVEIEAEWAADQDGRTDRARVEALKANCKSS